MSEAPAPSALFAKLAKIIGEVKSIPKSGHNDFHNYDYVTANDLINAVRDKLAAEGIFIFTSVKSQELREIVSADRDGKEKRSMITLVTLEHTFACAESGETFVVLSQGQGADVSDKGGYKAITGAMKYFIFKCFMIPTDEDSRELDVADPRPPSRPASAPARTASKTKEPEKAAPEKTPPGEIAWRNVVIHFGVYRGKKLGDLTENQLAAWFNWKPNPRYEKAEDRLLLAALESAAREVNG